MLSDICSHPLSVWWLHHSNVMRSRLDIRKSSCLYMAFGTALPRIFRVPWADAQIPPYHSRTPLVHLYVQRWNIAWQQFKATEPQTLFDLFESEVFVLEMYACSSSHVVCSLVLIWIEESFMHSTMQSVTGSSGPSRGKTCGSWLRFAAASMSIV